MRRPEPLLLLLVAVPVLFVGCGGGGSGPAPPQTSGQIAGRITGVSNPGEYAITVDGRPVSVRPGPGGSFTIPGVPPGQHTVGCIAPGGMQGGYAVVRVRRGATVNAGDVSPEMGGQIAGIVSRMLTDGTLEPVPQVEVTATSDLIVFTDPEPGEPVPVGRGAVDDQIVISDFTDESGSYLMKAVPPGGYNVNVIVAGEQPNIQYVWVGAGQTSVADFTLYPAPEQGVGTVEGTVTGQGEGALEGAQITLTTGQPWPIPLPTPVVDALLRGYVSAGVIAPGAGASQPGSGIPGDPGVPDLPPWIEVRVFSTLSDQNGHYTLNVPVGTHWIECWLDGWEWAGDEVVVEKNQTTTKDFDLVKANYVEPPPYRGPDPSRPVSPD